MKPSRRWTIVEYDLPSPCLQAIAEASGLPLSRIRDLCRSVGERIAVNLRLKSLPLLVERDALKSIDIAGLVRIAPGIELEIAPKFLGGDADFRWRDDFFFLAMLSKHGKILPAEKLRSNRTTSRTIPSLVALTMLEMQRINSRRPLRTYRRSVEELFQIDGDVDAESLVLPTPDGFIQEFIRYDRRNDFNSVIKLALQSLQRDVADPSIRMQLGRVVADLGTQSSAARAQYRRLPSRSYRWQEMYDLAVDVQKGIGLSLQPKGSPNSPGFVLSTWQVWEDLMTIASRLAFSHSEFHAQQKISWGDRSQIQGYRVIGTRPLNVQPDMRLENVVEIGLQRLILDAKYATRASADRQRISEADAYESFAFARATKANDVVLLYPSVPSGSTSVLGDLRTFEKIQIEDVVIYGAQIEVRGVSQRDGLRQLASGMRDGIKKILIT